MIDQYEQAFKRCYPHHHLKVIPKVIRRELRFIIQINGDKGDITLSEDDMQVAVRQFNRGIQ